VGRFRYKYITIKIRTVKNNFIKVQSKKKIFNIFRMTVINIIPYLKCVKVAQFTQWISTLYNAFMMFHWRIHVSLFVLKTIEFRIANAIHRYTYLTFNFLDFEISEWVLQWCVPNLYSVCHQQFIYLVKMFWFSILASFLIEKVNIVGTFNFWKVKIKKTKK